MRRRRRALVTVERDGRLFREPAGRSRPAHQARAALGVWACSRSRADRVAVKAWKMAPPFAEAPLAEFAAGLAKLITTWCPVLPPTALVTVPPAGASVPGPYAARLLGQRVAEALGLDFVELLSRSEPKQWHGVIHALKQEPFVYNYTGPIPPMVLVVDDLATTGSTLRLSLGAIRGAGIPAFGFAFSGV